MRQGWEQIPFPAPALWIQGGSTTPSCPRGASVGSSAPSHCVIHPPRAVG